MKKTCRAFAFTLSVLGCGLLQTTAISAADSMSGSMAPSMPKVDCSNPDAAMKSSMMMAHPAMTGNVDHDFAAMMVMHSKMGMEMAHIELQCGKDAKLKAAAQKTLDESHSDMMQYDPTLHTS